MKVVSSSRGAVDRLITGEIPKPEDVKPPAKVSQKAKAPHYPAGKPVATRMAYGNALVRIFEEFPEIVAIDGEVSNSTFSEIFEAVHKNWSTPTGLVSDSELATLSAEVRVSISADGLLGNPKVIKSSGNQYFDDSCVQAVKATGRVPPPPPGFKRGIRLGFEGKELTR